MMGSISIIAPLTGEIVALEQVPDPVFSEKALGDGIAILPEDGKVYSPVTGVVATVAATKHAYGFQSEDGLDVLVHVGLETVGLNGEGFTVHIKEGDKVKAGDLVAEADLSLLKSKNLNLITPVLICDGMDDKQMQPCSGRVTAAKDAVIVLEKTAAVTGNAQNSAGAASGNARTTQAPHPEMCKTAQAQHLVLRQAQPLLRPHPALRQGRKRKKAALILIFCRSWAKC